MPSALKLARKDVKSLRKAYHALKKAGNAEKTALKKAKQALKKAKKRVEALKASGAQTRDDIKAVEAGKRRRTRSLSMEMQKEKDTSSKKKKSKTEKKSDEAFAKFDDHFQRNDAAAWRKENNITIDNVGSDDGVFLSFEDLRAHIDAKVMSIIDKAGFEKPTPIQAQCWPIAMRKRDIVGVAETGSGKTLAFLIPALSMIVKEYKGQRKPNMPKMLVLSPTRELAMQIQEVADEACRICGLFSLCVYGGVPKGPQLSALRRGVDVLVATPGRLRDLVENSGLDLSGIKFFTLDEADRMLDLGFMPEIRAIASYMPAPKDRQSLMYTATWPNSVRKLAQEFVLNPVKVTAGSDVLTANHRVTQHVDVIEQREKVQRFQGLLRKYCGTAQKQKATKQRVLVFVLYKKEAARVERMLVQRGWSAVAIHGDKGQRDRESALASFKNGSKPMLVATDVAARGLDIPDVQVVINYSFPLTIEDYIHRIGRTGRAGKTGVSHTFFTRDDKARAAELTNILREAKQVIPPDLSKFGLYTKKKTHNLYGAHFKDVDMTKKAKRITFD